jgi:signal transduction histidine kinase
MFGWLMVLQWLAGIAFALLISPRTWQGAESSVHPHVWAAVVLGGCIASLPLLMIWTSPGQLVTRHVVAIAQMLDSALLIHLTGGRIETHFHVFGSLAFLAFYRDYRILISASLVVGVDHFARGLWWPESAYGVAVVSQWRWLEHVAWVTFEDVFLLLFCKRSIEELGMISHNQAILEVHQNRLEDARQQLEREVSERKRIEEYLVENADALRKSNAELEQFAYVSSHDLKEPLRMVMLYIDLLERSLSAKLDERQYKYMKFAVDGAHRMDALINDLLSYSQVGRRPAPMDSVALDDVVREALASLELAIMDAGATVELKRLPTITGNRGGLVRLFQNLISNAVKFRTDKKPRVRIDSRTDGECVIISVSDNGIGIAPEHHERIFELFQRLHTREAYPGTGIGLAICRKIAEQHRGTIMVESPPDGGTIFRVRLPIGTRETTKRRESDPMMQST